MHSKTMPIILNQNFTKISALILGYCIWYFSSSFQWVQQSFDIPVCFYQTEQRTVQACETVRITIAGSRKNMHYLNRQNMAINVDLSSYESGEHEIFLEESNLFLPEPLKLIELNPSIISITIQEPSET